MTKKTVRGIEPQIRCMLCDELIEGTAANISLPPGGAWESIGACFSCKQATAKIMGLVHANEETRRKRNSLVHLEVELRVPISLTEEELPDDNNELKALLVEMIGGLFYEEDPAHAAKLITDIVLKDTEE